MKLDQTLGYTREHAWIQINGSSGTIGITDFAQSELGEIVFVDLPSVGKSFKQGEIFGSVEAVKTVSDLFMPISGTIVEVNALLNETPVLINEDAMGQGWMIKIAIDNQEEIRSLLSLENYVKISGANA